MSAATLHGRHIVLVGPLPPPPGGMANQTEQLAALLRAAGANVTLVRSNAPWRPGWLARLRGWRALGRLLPFMAQLWRAAGQAELVHVMANSGWSWHLHAAPAIWIGRLRGKTVVVNYRGGEAARFLAAQAWLVRLSMARAHATIVPSAFLAGVFAVHRMPCQIVPNVVDLCHFCPGPRASPAGVVLVARQLEALYDNASALRAFALVCRARPGARLVVCGTGPESDRLHQLAGQLGIAGAVEFIGRVERQDMPALYRRCDVVLNSSLADNMPNSLLEALACRVPVVSTDVGGIPFLLKDRENALLVPPGDAPAMARALLAILEDPDRARQLADAGAALVRQYGWDHIAPRLAEQYRCATARRPPERYTRLAAGLLFPLQEKLKGHGSVALRRQLEQSQWWPASRLADAQLQGLRALLVRAEQQVPYYRRLFARLGFDPGKLRSLDGLRRLPILRKTDINDHRQDFFAGNAQALKRFNTGGSSGEPLIFFLGKERISHDIAAKWRATRWWGVDIGDREAVLWGSPIELTAQDRWRGWRDRLFRSRLLPAFAMSPARLDGFLAALRRLRPAMLFGYPSALCLLARHAAERGVRLDQLGIKVVFVTAERLYEHQRAELTAGFSCPVANGYGGRDAGFIAHECPQGGMHLSAEHIIVEIVDENGEPVPAGASGAIVVTHLATGDFPFIRYATGDVGALDTAPCPCGRGLPLLKNIEGRSSDFIVAQDGTVMHGLALIYILREMPEIRRFKIIQETRLLTRLLLVCPGGLAPEPRTRLVSQFRARLGQAVTIGIEEVDEIAAEASGKHRYVVSKIAHT